MRGYFCTRLGRGEGGGEERDRVVIILCHFPASLLTIALCTFQEKQTAMRFCLRSPSSTTAAPPAPQPPTLFKLSFKLSGQSSHASLVVLFGYNIFRFKRIERLLTDRQVPKVTTLQLSPLCLSTALGNPRMPCQLWLKKTGRESCVF